MDIDEFLDRELTDLGLQPDKNEKDSAELPEFRQDFQDFESSPLFESIRINLGNGNLDLAEQSYAQMWRIMIQQKLKWNSELYSQLLILGRQFSGALNSSYSDIKKKSDRIYGLIGEARTALRDGKKELPFKIYSEVEGISSSIPNIFFEEKNIMQEQAMEFYKELKSTTDNELVKRVYALAQEISSLVEKISGLISINDTANAVASYSKCIELYSQIPEGFLKHKNPLGMRILDIYKRLSISNEISSLQKQLVGSLRESNMPAGAPGPAQPSPLPNPSRAQESFQFRQQATAAAPNAKKERAKRNIEKGFYNEASKDIEEALKLEPNDAEAKALRAKIKTMQ